MEKYLQEVRTKYIFRQINIKESIPPTPERTAKQNKKHALGRIQKEKYKI